MFINLQNQIYFGDLAQGDRKATADEVAAWEQSRLPTPEDVQKSRMDAVQAHLDQAAQALGYDDIKSAATYADEDAVLRFMQEGQSLMAWRSLVWEHCNTLLASVQAGEREIPSESELIAGLPQRAAM